MGYHSPTVIRVSHAAMETFFDKNTGVLSVDAKGVLIVNATWAAARLGRLEILHPPQLVRSLSLFLVISVY